MRCFVWAAHTQYASNLLKLATENDDELVYIVDAEGCQVVKEPQVVLRSIIGHLGMSDQPIAMIVRLRAMCGAAQRQQQQQRHNSDVTC